MDIRRILIATACMAVLAACGNKGPLVLPQKPQPVIELDPLPAADETAPAATGEVSPEPATDPAPVPADDPTGDGDGTPR